MAQLREVVQHIEESVTVPTCDAEGFSGYAVMGLTFESGHVLALRRWPATSIGPGYTSVWHRTPEGSWTMYADAPPALSCARYFSTAMDRTIQAPIELAWEAGRTFRVRIGGTVGFDWRVTVATTPVTRTLNVMSSMMPGPLWHQAWFLAPMGRMVGPILGAGRVRLHGHVPNGQSFIANPRRMWMVSASEASLGGEDFGAMGPLPEQARLGDFWLPQRGVVAVADVFLENYDAARHASPESTPSVSAVPA